MITQQLETYYEILTTKEKVEVGAGVFCTRAYGELISICSTSIERNRPDNWMVYKNNTISTPSSICKILLNL